MRILKEVNVTEFSSSEKCIIDLFSAIKKIIPDYFKAIGTRYDQSQYPQNIEQSFSAELYHKFKTEMVKSVNKKYYEDLILHFDINKASVNSRPDLVLHKSQESREIQKMFIEVKTDPNANLEEDFNKLLMASDNYLNFENVISIIVNRPSSETKELIKSYSSFNTIDSKRISKIFFINVYSIDNYIEYKIFKFST